LALAASVLFLLAGHLFLSGMRFDYNSFRPPGPCGHDIGQGNQPARMRSSDQDKTPKSHSADHPISGKH
jgi:hypothetical protein